MAETEEGRVPPEGFEVSRSRGPFTTRNGPVFRAIDKDDPRSGIWVLDRHCNSMGFMHGGMVSSFADGALAWAVWHATRKMSVTLKLSTSFFGTIRPDDWLEAHPEVLSVHDGIVQVHARLLVGGDKLAARADGTFRALRRTAK
ncbi:PaaI family thioesterase [Henriciella aquimarina]|uniref:PaaI family thioesterase n=1 Tax=Henriciella aquimarina TaxID=545261 RepID=UPI0009FC37CC|nr:PaaI family thioesterase [Henriciella aquimarina]